MEEQFTVDRINLVVKVAQINAPGFTPEQYHALVRSQEEFSKTGFCEACWAVIQLHQEKDILYEEVVPAIEELLHQKDRLEAVIGKLKATQTLLQDSNSKAQAVLQQTQAELRQAQKVLRVLKKQQQETQLNLTALQEDANKEKERVHQELETFREQSRLTQVDIESARELKGKFQREGFDLVLALSLCNEFGKYENPPVELKEYLQKEDNLQNYLLSLSQRAESLKKDYLSQIQGLEGKCQKLEVVLSEQHAKYTQGELLLQNQNQQINTKADVLSFYQSYQPLRSLIDYLGNFQTVGFYLCSWCGAHYWVLRPGNTFHGQGTCLWCSVPMAGWDTKAYKAINRPPGIYKLLP